MRGKYIIIGGVFAILGTLLLFYGSYLIQSVEVNDVEGIPINDFLMTINDDSKAMYQLGKITQISGGIILIIGMCLIVVGGIIPDKKIRPKSSPVSQSEVINKSPSVSYYKTQNNLKTRYTKGEITKEQYEQMKKDLKEK